MECHDNNLVEPWPSLRLLPSLSASQRHTQDTLGLCVGLMRPGEIKDKHESLSSALTEDFQIT